MKLINFIIIALLFSWNSLFAGQSSLNTTYQPLINPGKSEVWIVPVTCHHWLNNSSSSSVDLIGVKNVPPSDKPDQAIQDLNLASICGVRFFINDRGATIDQKVTKIVIDITNMHIPDDFFIDREDVIRASIECLRRCLRVEEPPLTIEGLAEGKEWVAKIVGEYNGHDRRKPFFKSAR